MKNLNLKLIHFDLFHLNFLHFENHWLGDDVSSLLHDIHDFCNLLRGIQDFCNLLLCIHDDCILLLGIQLIYIHLHDIQNYFIAQFNFLNDSNYLIQYFAHLFQK